MSAPDAGMVGAALRARMPELVAYFRGEANRAMSSRSDLRWGRKGSFALHLVGRRAGRWDDHETGTGGDGLDLIMLERGCSLTDALLWASEWLGATHPAAPVNRPPASLPESSEAHLRTERARDLWKQAKPLSGTIVETYLAGRGLGLDDAVASGAIRFHPACPWRNGEGELVRACAMVAALSDIFTGEIVGVHRTALTPDGQKIGRKMLGRAERAVIRLSPDEEVSLGLGLVEGIENGLSVLAKGWRPVWACGSAGAIARFPVLPGIECLTVFGDHDQAGREAASAVTETYNAAGCEIAVRLPSQQGRDWNDAVRAGRAA